MQASKDALQNLDDSLKGQDHGGLEPTSRSFGWCLERQVDRTFAFKIRVVGRQAGTASRVRGRKEGRNSGLAETGE